MISPSKIVVTLFLVLAMPFGLVAAGSGASARQDLASISSRADGVCRPAAPLAVPGWPCGL